MKKRIATLLLAALLGLTACGAPAETGAPTGEIFIYGEEHANAGRPATVRECATCS